MHMINRRRRGGCRGGSAARLDDGGAALLHGGNKTVLEPGLIHQRQRRLAVDRGVVQIRILSCRVVAPDNDFLDGGQGSTGFFCELREAAVVIETRHRREAVARQRRSVALGDERIGVGRVAHHENAHIAACHRLQRFALR